jgi:YD repeat-containing protein
MARSHELNRTLVAVDVMQSGPPRAWEGSMPAGPFSSLSAWSGNLFTAVPIVGWGGRGPALGVGLFHNSASVDEYITCGYGVEISPGWSISYSGRIDATTHAPHVLVIEDDGTRNLFINDAGTYIAPPGVFDTLVQTTTPNEWILTRKFESKRIFSADGRLDRVVDSTGHTLTVVWETGVAIDRIAEIIDATGRKVQLEYVSGTDRLEQIVHPEHDPPLSGDLARPTRTWTLAYNTQLTPKMFEIRDPVYGATAPIIFDYKPRGLIKEVTDQFEAANRPGKTYAIYYTSGTDRVNRVVDPTDIGTEVNVSYLESPTEDGMWCRFTDRRSKVWEMESDEFNGELLETTNPLGQTWVMAYDTDHNVTSVTDPLSKVPAVYNYDGNGNMTQTTDALGNTYIYGYDAYNNLTTIQESAAQDLDLRVHRSPGPHPAHPHHRAGRRPGQWDRHHGIGLLQHDGRSRGPISWQPGLRGRSQRGHHLVQIRPVGTTGRGDRRRDPASRPDDTRGAAYSRSECNIC